MDTLTKKQKRILEFIEKYSKDNSYPPTLKDIALKFQITIGTIQDHIFALQRKGYLERKKDKARGFKIIKTTDGVDKPPGLDLGMIPLYGKVAECEPIFANDNINGYVVFEKKEKGNKIQFV